MRRGSLLLNGALGIMLRDLFGCTLFDAVKLRSLISTRSLVITGG